MKRDTKTIGRLSLTEIQNANNTLIKLVQTETFSEEKRRLLHGKSVSHSSKLIALHPFLDENNIIRVGGRLSLSNLSYDKKYPIVLPNKHPYTELLVKYTHIKQLHAGPTLTLSTIRQNYWILQGMRTVKGIIHKCMTCFRSKPVSMEQLMGNLPSYRIDPSPVFHSVGIDFAGPYLVKEGKLKNRKLVKTYFCIFVCMVTKAVHIEPVSDLTAESFLNTLKRFVSRRGLCKDVYSDNATNFISANNKLIQLKSMIMNESFQSYILDNQIVWHTIPARSPHMGGLWEAAIKSAKNHLQKIAKNVHFTYEHFFTLLTQIEGILNSRPLTPLTADLTETDVLTPGHFLIGRSMSSLPQEDVLNIPPNRLNVYQHLQQMLQHFWKRWSKDYLQTLQQRNKWRFAKDLENLLNSLVLLKDDHSHPCQWKIGRIIEVHPGSDNVIRVVTVKTNNGVVKRAINKVCLLPID